MSRLLSVCSVVGLLFTAPVLSAPLDVWGAARCELSTVGPTAQSCTGGWYQVTDANGDLTLDAAAGVVHVHGMLTLANGEVRYIVLSAPLVDADPAMSGDARILVGDELQAVLLHQTSLGWLKFGSETLGYFVRARAE